MSTSSSTFLKKDVTALLDENESKILDGFLKLAKELKKIGLDNGIYCNQTHTPDPTVIPYCVDVFKRSIETR